MAEVLPAELRIHVSGRGERSQADTDDLNVPLRLACELAGARHGSSRYR